MTKKKGGGRGKKKEEEEEETVFYKVKLKFIKLQFKALWLT